VGPLSGDLAGGGALATGRSSRRLDLPLNGPRFAADLELPSAMLLGPITKVPPITVLCPLPGRPSPALFPRPGPRLHPLPSAPRSLSLTLCPRPLSVVTRTRPGTSQPCPATPQPRPTTPQPRPSHAPPRPDTHHPRPGTAQPRPRHVQPRLNHAQPHPDTCPDSYFFRKALIRLTSSVCSASSGNTSSTSCSHAFP
jgi:hypothetical protein